MNYFPLFICLLFFACANNKKNISVKSKSSFEYDWIENSDFAKVTQSKVDLDKDFYQNLSLEDNIFKSESLIHSATKVSEQKFQSRDMLSQASYNCYRKKFLISDDILKRVYKKNIKNSRYFNVRGVCYFQQNKIDLAMVSFNKAISLDKKYSPAYNNLGVIYSKRNFKYLALKFFKKAYSRNLFSKTPKFNLANLYLSYGLYVKAEPLLLSLLKLKTNDEEINYSLSYLYLYKNKMNRSFMHLSRLKTVGSKVLKKILDLSKVDKPAAANLFKEHFGKSHLVYSKNLMIQWGSK